MDAASNAMVLNQNIITIAGISFVFGSLFTVLMLVILEYLRVRSENNKSV